MLRTVQIARARRPHPPPYKHRNKNQEEDTCHFKPEIPSHTPKWTQKARDAAPQASVVLSGASTAGSAIRIAGIRVRGSANLLCRVDLGIAVDALAGNTPRHAKPNAKHSADRLRSHFDMMVSATVGGRLLAPLPDLPVALGPLRK